MRAKDHAPEGYRFVFQGPGTEQSVRELAARLVPGRTIHLEPGHYAHPRGKHGEPKLGPNPPFCAWGWMVFVPVVEKEQSCVESPKKAG